MNKTNKTISGRATHTKSNMKEVEKQELKKGDIVEVFNMTFGGSPFFEGFATLLKCEYKDKYNPRWTVKFIEDGYIAVRGLTSDEITRKAMFKELTDGRS